MLYRLIFNVGLFALGYYLGREVGRAESVRERMRHLREGGSAVNLRDAVVIDMEQPIKDSEPQPTKH
jgi:hypothetical protein